MSEKKHIIQYNPRPRNQLIWRSNYKQRIHPNEARQSQTPSFGVAEDLTNYWPKPKIDFLAELA